MVKEVPTCDEKVQSVYAYLEETMQTIKNRIAWIFYGDTDLDPSSCSSSEDIYDQSFPNENMRMTSAKRSGIQRSAPVTRSSPQGFYGPTTNNQGQWQPVGNTGIPSGQGQPQVAPGFCGTTTNNQGQWRPVGNTGIPSGQGHPQVSPGFCGTTTNNQGQWQPVGNTGIPSGQGHPQVAPGFSGPTTNNQGQWQPVGNTGIPSGQGHPQVAPTFGNVNVNSSANHGGASSAIGNVYYPPSGPSFGNINVGSSANNGGQSSAVANVGVISHPRSGIQRSAPVTRSKPQSFYGSQSMDSQPIQKCYQDINNTLQDLNRCLDNILAKLS